MRVLALAAALSFLNVVDAGATAQAAEVLRIGRTEYPLYTNPLEKFYQKVRRPEFVESRQGSSTANWRGYVARWTIDGGRLYLTGIHSYVNGRRVTLRQLFPNRLQNARVFAEWFSGDLRVPDGRELQYVHMGYGSTFERDIIYTVQRGRVVSRRVIDNSKRPLRDEWEQGERELRELGRWEKRIRR